MNPAFFIAIALSLENVEKAQPLEIALVEVGTTTSVKWQLRVSTALVLPANSSPPVAPSDIATYVDFDSHGIARIPIPRMMPPTNALDLALITPKCKERPSIVIPAARIPKRITFELTGSCTPTGVK